MCIRDPAGRVGSRVGEVLAELTDLVLPRPCPGCGGAGPWCDACAATLVARPREPVMPDRVLDVLHAGRLPVPAVRSLVRYTGAARAAIIAGKERDRRDLPPRLGEALGAGLVTLDRLGVLGPRPHLIPAPTRASAARRRGGDPVLRMAAAAAPILAEVIGAGVTVTPVLRTRGRARDSAGLDQAQRAANLRERILVRQSLLPPRGSTVILLDDVLTTGATVTASILALQRYDVRVDVVLTVASVPPFRSIR